MKKKLFLAFLSLVVFNSCINDDNDCLRFSVTYALVSPDAEGDAPVDANRYSANDIVTVLDTDAVRPGFDFTGWNTQSDGSGDTYLPGETFVITGNVTLYAQWEQATVEITYLANGGIGTYTNTGLPYGSVHTVLSLAETGITRSPGYIFAAWNTQPDGSGTTYLPGDIITVTQNITLYAQWIEITFQVSYRPNGGVGGYILTGLSYGTLYTVQEMGATGIFRPGYTFTGWNALANGTGTPYSPGDRITIIQNVTLYAQWTSDQN